jgi:hypothetical protein
MLGPDRDGDAPLPVAYVASGRPVAGMAIAGFVLSFFCGALGLIFSALGRNECKRSEGTLGGSGLAIAGLIISIVNLIATMAFLWLVGTVEYRRHAIPERGLASAEATARDMVRHLGDAALLRWGDRCPGSLMDLADVRDFSALDPWGNPYELRCGPPIVVISAGPDGELGTPDDIRSSD